MTTYIPYVDGFSVGDTLDWTKENLGQSDAKSTIVDKSGPITDKPEVETRGCIVKTIEDVVQLLEIPPELALKVKIGQVKNPPIAEIVTDLYDENVITVVFQVRICLCTSGSNASNSQNADPSHLSKVTAKVWGDELIVVMKLRRKDVTQSIDLSYYNDVLSDYLDSDAVVIDDGDLNQLTKKWAPKLDKKISNAKDDSVPQMTVKCFSFDPFSQDPSTATGLMSVINSFRMKCQQLASSFSLPAEERFDNSPIRDFKHEQSRSSMGKHVVAPLSSRTGLIYQLRLCVLDNTGDVSKDERCKFVEKIYKAMRAIDETKPKIFQLNDPQVAVIRDGEDDYKIEKRLEELQKNLDGITQHVREMGPGVSSHESLDILCQNAIKQEDLQIPGGNPLIMALFGKTGHGKSSTGNSVLQDYLFAESSDVISMTKVEEKGETTTDGRELCIVDTPGLYDTDFTNLAKMKTEAIDFLNKVIALSPEGYDAFVLVIRYGVKVTSEETKTLTLFQRAFGEDVIKAHTVFVVTGGDQFLSKSKDSFNKWCHHTKSHDLDKLFKGCQYRCVLFDNTTTDKDVKKNQLIRLISLVDTIGSRYTDKTFQSAKASRDQLRQEILSPERRADLLNFLNFVLESAQNGEELKPDTMQHLSKIHKDAETLSDNDKSVICPLINNINLVLEQQNEMHQNERERKAREREEKIQHEKMEEILKALHQTSTLINAGTILFSGSLTILETYKTQAKKLPHNLQSIVDREISSIEDTCKKKEKARLEEEKERKKAEKYQEKVALLNQRLQYLSHFVINNAELDSSKLDNLNEIKTEAKGLKEYDCCYIVGQVEAIQKKHEKNEENNKQKKELEVAKKYQEEIKRMMISLGFMSSSVVMGNEINVADLKFLHKIEAQVLCLEENDQNDIQQQIDSIKTISDQNKFVREKLEKKSKENVEYQQKLQNMRYTLNEISQSVNMGEKISPEENEELDELKTEARSLKPEDKLLIKEQIKVVQKVSERNKKAKAEKRRREQIIGTILDQLNYIQDTLDQHKTINEDSLKKLKTHEAQIGDFPEEEKIDIIAKKRKIMETLENKAKRTIGDHNKITDEKLFDYLKKYNKYDCFSADDVVETNDGSKVKIENLNVGDFVLARDGKGKLFYDPVYMFGHREEDAFRDFIIIETTKQNVSVTENHLVFCVRNEIEGCVPAGCVQPGDKLMVAVSDQTVEQIPIIKVSRQRKRGLFAPFTKSGTVVVNGALMSCYVNIVTHQTAHNALWPLRQLYDISPATLAYFNGAKKNTTIPVWAETTYNVISYVKNTRNKLSKYLS